MTSDPVAIDVGAPSRPVSTILFRISLVLLIFTLAWAPFPLGSNRAWSSSLLTLLVASCWCLFGVANWHGIERSWSALRTLRWPMLFGAVVLIVAIIQIVPIVPSDLASSLWRRASVVLHKPLPSTISINPWESATEIIKLITYVGTFILAFLFALRNDTANTLLNVVIGITGFYAGYAVLLQLLGYVQYQLFYPGPPVTMGLLSGPFVLHNTYATFAGLGSLAAAVKLGSLASRMIDWRRGFAHGLLSLISFAFGSGVLPAIAFVLTFSTLVASASRAGFLATMVALLAMSLAAAFIGKRKSTMYGGAITAGVVLILTVGLIGLSGDVLVLRLNELVDAGSIDDIRSVLWTVSGRMILAKPLLGFGLGTFQDAYPTFTDRVLPFVIDKAHNDYLELAVGVGLPAAVACWTAFLFLIIRCFRGIYTRRRNRHYPVLGFGSCILVAIHSGFDFSLQIPAVGLLFSVLLGISLAQCLQESARHSL